jgi:galactose mutarotase-like enzyme
MPSDAQSGWVRISSEELSAEIDPHGAQLSRLSDRASRDLLWNGDPAVWTGRAPLLFPIVGALAGGSYRWGSNSYPLSRHGFARGKNFSIVSVNAASASFKLSADPSTLQVYPFRFELLVLFQLARYTLSVITTIRNLGSDAMPASFGYHPAFRWPLPYGESRARHSIDFETDEPEPVRRLDSAGLLMPERHPSPVEHRRLPLTDALFQDDVLILDKIRSRSVSYGGTQGPRLRIGFPDAPYLGIWTKPGAQFICIEPWHGIADPVGFASDFKSKPGICLLGAGKELAATMTITLSESPATESLSQS